MLNAFWNAFVIILTLLSIFGCWWLLKWTSGISNRKGDKIGSTGHVWDEDLVELNAPLPKWWLNLFHITIVFSLIYLVLFPGLGNVPGVLGWTQIGRYDEQMVASQAAQETVYAPFRAMEPKALVANPEAREIGRRLFANNCAMCHGSDGRGAPTFPNLTDSDWLYGSDYDQILTSITLGRNGVMPAMGAVLGEPGLAEVTAYVQQLSGQTVDNNLASAGKTKFDMLCAACHGVDGKGNVALGAPNLTDDVWLYGGTAEKVSETIAKGRNGKMPAHESLLSEDRRRLVAAYVAGLSE